MFQMGKEALLAWVERRPRDCKSSNLAEDFFVPEVALLVIDAVEVCFEARQNDDVVAKIKPYWTRSHVVGTE